MSGTVTSSTSRANVIALVMLSNPGAVIAVVMPTLVNAFVARGIALGQASRLGATEIFSCAVMVLVAPLLLARINRRHLAISAILAVIAGQFLTLATTATALLIVCRTVAGFGEGLLYAVAIGSLAATPMPQRALALSVASNQAMATLLIIAITALSRIAPASAALLVIGGFVALHLPLTAVLNTSVESAVSPVRAATTSQGRVAAIALGLLAMFLLSMGFGTVWPMITIIGADLHISQGQIALALSLAGLSGIAGATASASTGRWIEKRYAMIVGVAGFCLAMALTQSAMFVIATVLMMFFWTFSVPYFLAMLAEIDATGRLSVLSSAMIAFGIAAGQVYAGFVAGPAFALVVDGGLVMIAGALGAALVTIGLTRRTKVASTAA